MTRKQKVIYIISAALITAVVSTVICLLFRLERLESFKTALGTIARTTAVEIDSRRITPGELRKSIPGKHCSFLIFTRLKNNRFEPIAGKCFPRNYISFLPEVSDQVIHFPANGTFPEFSTKSIRKDNILAIIVPIRKFNKQTAYCFIGGPFPEIDYLKYLYITLLCFLPFTLIAVYTILHRSPIGLKPASDSEITDNQLLQLGRLASLRQVTSGIIHEMNQPLCVIKGYLGLLQMMWTLDNEDDEEAGATEDDDQQTSLKYLELCLQNVDRTGHILDHIRNFVKDCSKEETHVDCLDAVKNVMDFFSEQFGKRNIKLELKLPEQVSRVFISQPLLEQAIVNLLSNARDSFSGESYKGYGSGKKNVTLTLEEVKNNMVFTLEDNGIGMDGEVLSKCTTPFFTTNPDSSGVGLTMVKIIVENAGGSFKVSSINGRGTSVTVSLPVKQL